MSALAELRRVDGLDAGAEHLRRRTRRTTEPGRRCPATGVGRDSGQSQRWDPEAGEVDQQDGGDAAEHVRVHHGEDPEGQHHRRDRRPHDRDRDAQDEDARLGHEEDHDVLAEAADHLGERRLGLAPVEERLPHAVPARRRRDPDAEQTEHQEQGHGRDRDVPTSPLTSDGAALELTSARLPAPIGGAH